MGLLRKVGAKGKSDLNPTPLLREAIRGSFSKTYVHISFMLEIKRNKSNKNMVQRLFILFTAE